MGLSRQEYWSGLPFPPPEDLPDPGTKPKPVMSPALPGKFFTTRSTWDCKRLDKRNIIILDDIEVLKRQAFRFQLVDCSL